jgi:hypothetical protein
MGGSWSTLNEKFDTLKQQGRHVGPVVTRQGFGHAVERQGSLGTDYIVKYVFPTNKHKAIVQSAAVRSDFMVVGAKYRDGALHAKVAFGKNQYKWVPLQDNMFDQRPFKDKHTLRLIVTEAYDKYQALGLDQGSSYSSQDEPVQKGKSTDSTETMSCDDDINGAGNEYEYEYEYQQEEDSLSKQD